MWQEGIGSFLLLAAAQETGLLEQMVTAVMDLADPSMPGMNPPNRGVVARLILTLLLLPVAGLARIWDLRSYTGTLLALVTGRERAYSQRSTERFLSSLAKAGAAECLTTVITKWTWSLWHTEPPSAEQSGPPVVFYIDGHRKAVVRRVTRHEFPVQPGWVGKEAHGPAGFPGDESQRGQEHAGNARNDQKTLMTWPRAPASYGECYTA